MPISVKLQNLSLGTGEIEISSETGKEKDDYILYYNFCYLASLFNVVFLCFPHSILYLHKSPLLKLLFQAYTSPESDFALQKLFIVLIYEQILFPNILQWAQQSSLVTQPDDSVYLYLYFTI